MSDGICVICGYPHAYMASSEYSSACSVCADRIYYAKDPPENPKARRVWDATGDGFDGSFKEHIVIAKEQFSKLQDRSLYKVGDRIQIRINREEDRWCTVMEYSGGTVLLYMDDPYKEALHSSWKPASNIYGTTATKFGLDPSKAHYFWWGALSANDPNGSANIVAIQHIPKIEQTMTNPINGNLKFTPSQDRKAYKYGDRLLIKIKGDKEVWATVIDHASSEGTALYLDEEHEWENGRPWETIETVRGKLAEDLGLDRFARKFLFWGTTARVLGLEAKEIEVLKVGMGILPITPPDPKLQDRKQYSVGDRLRVKIHKNKEVWATVIQQHDLDGTILFLDEHKSWKANGTTGSTWTTANPARKDAIRSLGLEPSKSQCFYWDPSGSYASTCEGCQKDELVVLEYQPAKEKMSEVYYYDCETEKLDGKDHVYPACKSFKEHSASQMKVYASSKGDGKVELFHLCQDHHDHQKQYNWTTTGWKKWLPMEAGAAKTYQKGDRLQIKVGNHITWATVVDPEGRSSRTAEPLLHLDQRHNGAHRSLSIGTIAKIKEMGFNSEQPNFWWLEPKDTVLYRQVPEKVEPRRIKAGDSVKYIENGDTDLVNGTIYTVKEVRQSDDPKEDRIYLAAFGDSGSGAYWYASRFQHLEATALPAIGDRLEVENVDKTGRSWSTVVGYDVGVDGKDHPIVYLDAPQSKGFGGKISSFPKQEKDIRANMVEMKLDPEASKFWFADSYHTNILAHAPKASTFPPEGNIRVDVPAQTISFGGNTPTPLNFTFDSVGWKISSAAPITFVSSAQPEEPKAIKEPNLDPWFDWEGVKAQSSKNFIVDLPLNLDLEAKEWLADIGNNPSKEIIPKVSKEPVEQSFGSMVKEDAISAGYRVAANQLTKGIKAALLQLMKDKGTEDGKIAVMRELLDTEMGSAFIATLLGYSLTYIPGIDKDGRAQRLAGEFRVGSMAIAGNAIMDVIWQYIRNLPAPEKVRVDTSEIRVSEPEEEEIVNEKENVAGHH